MRLFLAGVCVGLFLSWSIACGGGGGPDSEHGTQPPQIIRTDLLYGYFGDSDGQVAATVDHVNLEFIMGWGDNTSSPAYLRHAAEAVGAGHKIILGVCWRCGPENIRYQFSRLRELDALKLVVALYPEDEPNLSLTEGEISNVLRDLRAIVSDFDELKGVKFAAIYAQNHGWAGSYLFDWIGVDDYGVGVNVPPLIPGQRVILVPGGANPWREDPAPFLAYANAHPEVVGIIAFLWRWPSGPDTGHGIADNGLTETYRAAGRAILH